MTPPILFLAFNRPDTTARVFDAIRAARPKRLYVAADGSRANRPDEAENCAEVRKIATTLDWPCEIKTLFRDRNLGCGNAVRTAIDWFFEHEEEGIILEDDCLPSPDFFRFCSELLERFRHEKRIMAICGSCYAEPHTSYGASYYFSYYSDPWGWATWRRAWRLYDRDWSRWCEFQARGGLKDISAGRLWHETYWSKCFEIGRKGEEHIWDYQWIYSVIEQGGLACYPVRNLISNIGYRSDATHTKTPTGLPANLPHRRLDFPLRHTMEIERLISLERQIEAVRLDLIAPKGEQDVSLGTAINKVLRLALKTRHIMR